MNSIPAITRRQAIAKLWELGRISEMKLHSDQKKVYDRFHANTSRMFLTNCSRRWGKSYFLTTVCFEECLRNPGAQIRYAAPTAKMIRKYLLPLIRQLTGDCPKHLKPHYKTQDGVLVFPNESEIYICGTEQDRAEGLRGTGADLVVVDEAGFVNNLDYVIKDILLPQTLTTGGRIMIASTPPIAFDHPYMEFVELAQSEGAYMRRTVYDNPLLTDKDIADIIRYCGGVNSNAFRREFLAEFLVDTEWVVIPEFDAEAEDDIVGEVERPAAFDTYVGMDLGFLDNTAVLFGYWDFTNAQLVIEDELIINKMTTDVLAAKIKQTEQYLWGRKRPYLRVSDVDLLTIADLSSLHDLHFTPTAKDKLEVAVNALRMLVYERKIKIHPRCTNLIAQLKFATWDKTRTKFSRSAKHGHYDAVAALIYLVRNLVRNKNPYTNKYGLRSRDDWVIPDKPNYSDSVESTFKHIFSPERYIK